MSKLPVSVCIIAKNEEKYIEECLKKLKPYGFEIVVTDTGSTDKTVEIAKKYADKVEYFEWINDFAAARNYCASKAKNNWILALDCDEYVESLDVRIFRVILQQFPKKVGVIRMKSVQLRANDELGYSTDDLPRLYNRNYYQYINPIHEQIYYKDKKEIDQEITGQLLPMEVIHHGYAIKGEEMVKKQQRNLEILMKALEKEPDNAYYYFQIGCSKHVLEELDEAAANYEKSLELNSSANLVYVRELMISLSHIYRQQGTPQKSIELFESHPDTLSKASILYEYANAQFDANQPLKALFNYLRCTMLKDTHNLGENLLLCYERIINIYQSTGNEDMAKPFENKYLQLRAERERITGTNA